MAQENREVYIAWLREKLEDYCNDDGSYEVYWDYDDSITPDQLVEAVDNWKSEGYTSPESYLASTLYDTVGEAQESQLYVSILDDLNDAPDEVRACWDESTGIWDDLYEAGYTGIDMNLDDLLSRSSFNVNLFFATETEKNFDMGSIVDSFGNDYREPRLEDIDAESLDNALSYLVNQQGHSVEEVFGNPDNAFIHSIREEIDENSSEAMSELCALVRMDAREMLDLIGKRSEAKGSLVLPRDCATMGIFNQWSGCGGVLDILLEKDAEHAPLHDSRVPNRGSVRPRGVHGQRRLRSRRFLLETSPTQRRHRDRREGGLRARFAEGPRHGLGNRGTGGRRAGEPESRRQGVSCCVRGAGGTWGICRGPRT